MARMGRKGTAYSLVALDEVRCVHILVLYLMIVSDAIHVGFILIFGKRTKR